MKGCLTKWGRIMAVFYCRAILFDHFHFILREEGSRSIFYRSYEASKLSMKTPWSALPKPLRITNGVALKHGWMPVLICKSNTTKLRLPNSSIRSEHSLVQRETPPQGRNNGNDASSSASSPILSLKPGPHWKGWDQVLIAVVWHQLSFI